MKFKTVIEQILIDFITHWNNKDMVKFATYLSNDIIISSPNIIKLYPSNTESKLYKKENVMAYWKQLNSENFFVMKLIVLNKTDKVIKCEIDIGSKDTKLYATYILDEYGKFIEINIEYL